MITLSAFGTQPVTSVDILLLPASESSRWRGGIYDLTVLPHHLKKKQGCNHHVKQASCRPGIPNIRTQIPKPASYIPSKKSRQFNPTLHNLCTSRGRCKSYISQTMNCRNTNDQPRTPDLKPTPVKERPGTLEEGFGDFSAIHLLGNLAQRCFLNIQACLKIREWGLVHKSCPK